MATYSFTTTESTSQQQDITLTISDMQNGGATSASVNTGSASILSQSGTSVTVRCINGTSTRSTSGTVLVPESKTGSATVSQVYTWSAIEGSGAWYGDTVQTSAPSTISASDGIHTLSLDSITIDSYPSAPSGGGTEGQKVTRYGTGHGNYSGYTNSTSTTYYYQYSGSVTYTPIPLTGGAIEFVSANENNISVRIKNLEFGSGYSQLVIQGPSGTQGVSIAGGNGVSYYSSTATFTGLTPLTSYSFTAKFTYPNQSPNTSTASYSTTAHVNVAPTLNFSNLDGLNAYTATFSAYDEDGLRATNTYSLQISGPDNTSYGTAVYVSNTAQNTNLNYTFQKDSTGANFVVGKTYTVRIILYDSSNLSTEATRSKAHTKSRPANFAWTTAKTSGTVINVTAAEWNTLIDKVNEFQEYKGVTRTVMTKVSSGDIFYFSNFNEVRNAINTLTPPTAPPATVASLGTIYAADLNKLRDSINSIA